MGKLEEMLKYGLYGAERAAFMAPVMLPAELISGLNSIQSLKSRALSLGVNFAVAMPYQNWFRPFVHNLLGVDETSSEKKKKFANRVAFAAHQTPLYGAMLYALDVPSEQIAITLPVGVIAGVAISGRFQKFMNSASEYIENKYYQAKDKFSRALNLGKSYMRNLVYASAIAAATKISLQQTIDYAKENNCITNECVAIYNPGTEGTYWIRKDEFDESKHLRAFPD